MKQRIITAGKEKALFVLSNLLNLQLWRFWYLGLLPSLTVSLACHRTCFLYTDWFSTIIRCMRLFAHVSSVRKRKCRVRNGIFQLSPMISCRNSKGYYADTCAVRRKISWWRLRTSRWCRAPCSKCLVLKRNSYYRNTVRRCPFIMRLVEWILFAVVENNILHLQLLVTTIRTSLHTY